jgi:phage terminase large subunit
VVQLFNTYTDVFYWNIQAKKRFVGNQGGTSSSKTISVLQVLCHIAISEKCIITVVGQDIPNLKKGSLRDFQTTILESMHEDFRWWFNDFKSQDRIYKLPNGSIIEFASFSDWQDAKNGKRDYLFINESNGINYTIAEQLISRTRKQIFFDWNPDTEYWYHDHIKTDERCVTYYSNYTHNPFVPAEILADIMSWQFKNPRKYSIYGLGRTGKLDGLIYPNYELIQDMPFIFDKQVYALDFGFTDPMSLNHLRAWNDQLFVEEIFYESFKTVAEMDRTISIDKSVKLVCDNARPESIKELVQMGYNAVAVEKGKGSVISGIEAVQKYKIHLTVNSSNTRNEIKNYVRVYDKKAGKFIDEPVDDNNHSMDAIRYGVSYMASKVNTNKTRYNGRL